MFACNMLQPFLQLGEEVCVVMHCASPVRERLSPQRKTERERRAIFQQELSTSLSYVSFLSYTDVLNI